MKKILLFLFLISAFASAQVDIQTNFELSAPLPIDTRFEAATTIARDAFPNVQRWEGMTVYVLEDSTNYQLVGGLNNSDWINIQNKFSGDSITIGGRVIRFNESEGTFEFETGKGDVVWQGALESLMLAYNNTGALIENGKAIHFTGSNGDSIPTIGLSSNDDSTAIALSGLATVDIPDGDWGFMNVRGFVRSLNTSGLLVGEIVYLATNGDLTSTMPVAPAKIIIIGICLKSHASEGIILVNLSYELQRTFVTKDYTFTSQGIGSGTYYLGGNYDFPSTDANLTQASSTVIYGTANDPHGKHASVIAGGAGTVDTGVIGLSVSGASYNDSGGVISAFEDTIITDITTVALNEYFEGKKFVGAVDFQLIVMSGSPTTYSFDFNYGLAKYEDVGNKDFYITEIDMGLNVSFSDASFNIEILHHKNTGWTYAATGFTPGDGIIESWANTYGPNDDVINGNWYAWKITDINQFIDGNGPEGMLFRITTGGSNTIQSMNLHIGVEIEN
jgi:hypothetical protein